MVRRTRHLLAVSLLAITLGSGCFVSPRVAHNVGAVASAAIWTAAILGTIAVLAAHDDHFHYEHCGHYRRWHEERWVYYYTDRWEYYDDSSATWYFYAD